MRSGVLSGFPLVGVRATLIDGAFHDKGSSPLAFEIAARKAFREGLRDGEAVLLEPVMAVEITIPEDDVGSVVGDLRVRRGIVQELERRQDAVVVKGLVPVANTFGYANRLRSGTQGHGTFTMRFSHYAPTPPCPNDDGPAAPAIALCG